MSLPKLHAIQRAIAQCRDCPEMVGRPVHGPAVQSKIFLLGQAPGVHEESRGRPFAHTAGKTLFKWFEESGGVSESHFRERVYMAAVARCFPGKASRGGGDRLPDAEEIARCRRHLALEVKLLRPALILAVGKLAIAQVLGPEVFKATSKLTEVVGPLHRARFLDHDADVICLPHPSGLSAWHKVEPGKSLLRKALTELSRHPAWRETME